MGTRTMKTIVIIRMYMIDMGWRITSMMMKRMSTMMRNIYVFIYIESEKILEICPSPSYTNRECAEKSDKVHLHVPKSLGKNSSK